MHKPCSDSQRHNSDNHRPRSSPCYSSWVGVPQYRQLDTRHTAEYTDCTPPQYRSPPCVAVIVPRRIALPPPLAAAAMSPLKNSACTLRDSVRCPPRRLKIMGLSI